MRKSVLKRSSYILPLSIARVSGAIARGEGKVAMEEHRNGEFVGCKNGFACCWDSFIKPFVDVGSTDRGTFL